MARKLVSTIRAIGASVVLAMLVACAGTGYGPRDIPGETVAQNLTNRYYDLMHNCPLPEMVGVGPAPLCSGILMRATARGVGFHVWNPNPNSPTRNGVSFSWLNLSTAFGGLALGFNNGFIVLPPSLAGGYTRLIVLCAFPFDGATWGRQSGNFDGCGAYTGIGESAPCETLGVVTSEQWVARYGSGGMYGNQCGFTLWPYTEGTMQAFYQLERVRLALPGWFPTNDEVMIRTWAQNDPGLPLEAFFYLSGSSAGRAEAMANQADFRATTSRWVPVIQIRLPTATLGGAAFRYLPEDQAIPAGGAL